MPALGNMHECERVIKQINRQPHGKEKLFDLLMAHVSDRFFNCKKKNDNLNRRRL